jgi:hypothetical protein
MKPISPGGVFVRFIVALVLVFSSYNPEGYSYYHWVLLDYKDISPLKLLAGILLLTGWVIYIRATVRSLGFLGLILAIAFFAALIWLIIDLGWIHANTPRAVSYIGLFILCAVLAAGMSWSHIRRRISGQVDVDDLEEP